MVDIITPFTFIKSIAIPFRDGIGLFNGEFGAKYISFNNGAIQFKEFSLTDYPAFVICGYINNYIVVPQYNDEFKNFKIFNMFLLMIL